MPLSVEPRAEYYKVLAHKPKEKISKAGILEILKKLRKELKDYLILIWVLNTKGVSST